MENKEGKEKIINLVSQSQNILIKKILKSKKIKDKEYKELKKIKDGKVISSYDASIFICYVLALLKFRQNFTGRKAKAYKKCFFCDERDEVERYLRVGNLKVKAWVCSSCAINLRGKIVPVKEKKEKDFIKVGNFKYEYPSEVEDMNEDEIKSIRLED